MIVDTSPLISILRNEPERDQFIEILGRRAGRISAANWFEAAMVSDSARLHAGDRFDQLVESARLTIEPVTEAHARAARIAFRRYGRGSGSPAKLNFGDCFAYALSATSGEPLLFKGRNFTHTDVLRAID